MQCDKCGKGIYRERTDKLICSEPFIGDITVYNVTYSVCDNCKAFLLPIETCSILDKERDKIFTDWLLHQPIHQFLSLKQTAEILNVTPQFLSRNKKIKSGLIFQAKKGKYTYYLKKSVKQYKKTGDGRFNLPKEELLFLQQREQEQKKQEHGFDIVLD